MFYLFFIAVVIQGRVDVVSLTFAILSYWLVIHDLINLLYIIDTSVTNDLL